MAEYRTPGVYVEEITTLAPSAAQVQTAIPAFIGYTERAMKTGTNLTNVPTYISSIIEFKKYFGAGYEPNRIDVNFDNSNAISSVKFDNRFYLYDNIRLFYANGGSQCYIVSVGSYGDDIDKEAIANGIDACKREDNITMLLTPDVVQLKSKDDCYDLQKIMLTQSAKLKDRVAVMDIYDGYKALDDNDDVITNFRTGIGINSLQFGAAYYPWLQTTYALNFSYKNVVFNDSKGKSVTLKDLGANPALVDNLETSIADSSAIKGFISNPFGDKSSLKDKYTAVDKKSVGKKPEAVKKIAVTKDYLKRMLNMVVGLTNSTVKNEVKLKTDSKSVVATVVGTLYSVDIAIQAGAIDAKKEFLEYGLSKVKPYGELVGVKDEAKIVATATKITDSLIDNLEKLVQSIGKDAESIEEQFDKIVYDNIQIYQTVVAEIQKEASKIPPAGAMAGVYSAVDDARGVWKAPANVSVNNVVKPWVKIDNAQQENLNIDTVGGKSVNAIRTFPGQGVLVWGARTLAGNDNEWRYISVRRFFNMVEKTLKLSTNWAVFEPNSDMTWIRLRAMMNNYLTNLWSAGALVGATPSEAFFVNVGLGSTMTQIDVLEGRMIIEVGMAVVRPAEFIIIKFSHFVGGGEGGE